jgi:hypothetical protein
MTTSLEGVGSWYDESIGATEDHATTAKIEIPSVEGGIRPVSGRRVATLFGITPAERDPG